MTELRYEEIKLRVKRYTIVYAFAARAVVIPEGNVAVEVDNKEGTMSGIYAQVRLMINALTQEHFQLKYPRTWWDAVKARWFPKWLLRKFPIKYNAVWTTHVFPEMAVPKQGKEFVTLKVIPYEAFEQENRNEN